MSLTHVTALRNTLADAVDAAINSGAGTAVLEILDGATLLVSFNLQNPAFGAAASGIITLQGTTISATAGASGTADGFQIKDRDGTVLISGAVTATGGGGDIEVTNTNIASGQACDLDSLTYETCA